MSSFQEQSMRKLGCVAWRNFITNCMKVWICVSCPNFITNYIEVPVEFSRSHLKLAIECFECKFFSETT
jgi:hypothetical protein